MTIFKLVFSNRPFFILTILYGVMTFAIALITAGLPFAALYLILDDGTTFLSGAANALSVLSLMFAAFVIGSILSRPPGCYFRQDWANLGHWSWG